MKNKDLSGWQLFLQLCQHVKNSEQLNALFSFLFTAEEKQHISTRILLVQELLKGKRTQREIAKTLNISIAKITRGSNNLKQLNENFKKYLQDEMF